MNILIIYPSSFLSYSKFERKTANILSKKSPEKVSYCFDPNGLIDKFFTEHFPNTLKEKISEFHFDGITHSIIFDDGEEFIKEWDELRQKGVPVRRIRIKITRVINIKIDTKYKGITSNEEYEYIGRGSYWGNPYSMYEDGENRSEVIRKFKYDFDYNKFPNKNKSEVYKLAGKRLGCFCKPHACHGDVLAEFLNSWDDGE